MIKPIEFENAILKEIKKEKEAKIEVIRFVV